MITAKQLAEMARDMHYAIVTSEGPQAGSRHPVHKASERLFKDMIKLAYPDYDAEYVFNTWCIDLDSVAWTVRTVRRALAEEKEARDCEYRLIKEGVWEGATYAFEDIQDGLQVSGALGYWID